MATMDDNVFMVFKLFIDGDGNFGADYRGVFRSVESAKAFIGAESYVEMTTLDEYKKRYYTMDGGLAPYDMATHTRIHAPQYVIVPEQVI